MSHYVSREQAKIKDHLAIEAIVACDPQRLHRIVRREGITMCGFHPTTALLVAAQELGATSAELIATRPQPMSLRMTPAWSVTPGWLWHKDERGEFS